MKDHETRIEMLLRRRNILITNGGELTPAEVLWVSQIDMELGIT